MPTRLKKCTPLGLAKQRGDEAMVALLVEFGANEDAAGGGGLAENPNQGKPTTAAATQQANSAEGTRRSRRIYELALVLTMSPKAWTSLAD